MKKIFVLLSAVAIFFSACQEGQDNVEPKEGENIDMSDFYVYTDDASLKGAHEHDRTCHTMKVLNQKLMENPGLERKLYNIELHTRKAIAAKKPDGKPGGGNGGGNNGGSDPVYEGAIVIPVIVNILEDYNGQVSQSQIQSQIDVLNEDYNDANPRTNGVPSEFAGVIANCDISFTLAAVNRKISNKSTWGTSDAMKYSSQGGIDVTDPSRYLNLWVCNIGGGILGYAQFPGGDPATDGVVIGTDYFGVTSGVYGGGRTCTHEVGHWLNLRHIWGDGRCKQDDFVTDTPASDRANYGCPVYPTVHCRSNDMTMNYMDYVYDDCMYMFTSGQNERMRALFASGGARESFVN